MRVTLQTPSFEIGLPGNFPLVETMGNSGSMPWQRAPELIKKPYIRHVGPNALFRHRAVMADSDVIGKGPIGDKALQLMAKGPTFRRLGKDLSLECRTVPRTVLAQDTLEHALQVNGMGHTLTEALRSKDAEAFCKDHLRLPDNLMVLLRKIAKRYKGFPMVVRSSAAGDSLGMGQYETVMCPANYLELAHATRKVLGSFFSTNTRILRAQAGDLDNFGIIIEPAVGQHLRGLRCKQQFFAPVMSGFGFTQPQNGIPYVITVPGFGGSVSTRYGEKIDPALIAKYKATSLTTFLSAAKDDSLVVKSYSTYRESLWLKTIHDQIIVRLRGNEYDHTYPGHVFLMNDRKRQLSLDKIYFQNTINHSFFVQWDLNELFILFDELTKTFGCNQYIEFAITVERDSSGQLRPVIWLLQISDIPNIESMKEHHVPSDYYLKATSTIGAGKYQCSDIFICLDRDDFQRLKEYNQNHKDYLLVCSSYFKSGLKRSDFQEMELQHMHNAAGILEVIESTHTETVVSHWEGTLKHTGKFFGALDRMSAMKIKQAHEMAVPFDDATIEVIVNPRAGELFVVTNQS
jgi:hypothetical protein